MIDIFESSVRITPDKTFFTFIDKTGEQLSYTYKESRVVAAALARKLQAVGVHQGDMVVVDLPNCPEFIFLILASAYGGFTLVTLDQRLSEAERLARVMELDREGMRIAYQIDEARARQMMRYVRVLSSDESTIIEGIYGNARRERAIMGERQDIIDDTVHFAERAAHLFDSNSRAGIMFTGGKSAKSKAVPLTWEQLVGASQAANDSLVERGQQLWQTKLPLGTSTPLGEPMPAVVWQCAMPLCEIGGFQVLVRSVIGRTPLWLYETFDAERVLHDCEQFHITHIAVTDQMLQDLLTIEEWRVDLQPGAKSRLRDYQCILISEHKLNARTVERSLEGGARIFASYGMTETSSLLATTMVTPEFRGGLRLLEGYEAHIVDADEDGFGRLAVKGPGVFDGYLNASAAFTVDHFFITGAVAALYDGCIYVRNRSANMFVSDGQTVYPEEIADVLRHVPGVSAAHVFGVADARCGRRPVAVVERATPAVTPQYVDATARPWLSGQKLPDGILVVDALPRTETGKIDRRATEELFRARLQVQRVVLHHIRLPFHEPFQTALGALEHRDSILVEVVDALGRVGLGECVSFDASWGLAETLPQDVVYMKDVLIPALIGRVMLHPREVSELFAQLPNIDEHPMAASALENALWDLYGQASEQPLWQLINEEYAAIWKASGYAEAYRAFPRMAEISGHEAKVAAGAVIGLGPTPVAMANADAAVRSGYRRLKMKIAPGVGFASVQAVRRAFPDLLITLDANRSFTDDDLQELKAYDGLNIGWIEEPFDVSGGSTAARRDELVKMDAMQAQLATPLCADESYANAQQAQRILQYSNIHCIAIKAAKFGGIMACLRFIAQAKLLGRVVWMGGMYETGVARRVSAAFETLPDMIFPGDVGSTQHFFETDVTNPPYVATNGMVVLNDAAHPFGLGCTLDEQALAEVELERIAFE